MKHRYEKTEEYFYSMNVMEQSRLSMRVKKGIVVESASFNHQENRAVHITRCLIVSIRISVLSRVSLFIRLFASLRLL